MDLKYKIRKKILFLYNLYSFRRFYLDLRRATTGLSYRELKLRDMDNFVMKIDTEFVNKFSCRSQMFFQ